MAGGGALMGGAGGAGVDIGGRGALRGFAGEAGTQ